MPIRVLYVDADEDSATRAAESLEREDDDIEVVTATSGDAGLQRLATTDVDCVVSDHPPVDTDGLAFLDAVRDADPTLPFVLFTAEGPEAAAARAVSEGATEYLRRTGDSEQYALLAELVREAVERSRVDRKNARAGRVLEGANEGISLIDEDGRFVFVNDAYADIYGYDPDELVGERWEVLSHDEDRPPVDGEARRALEERGEWRGETRGKRKDGTTVIEDHSLAVADDGGIICVVRDVTGRERRQHRIEALHEATRLLMAAESKEEVAERTAEAAKTTLDYPFSVVRMLNDEDRLAPVVVTEEMQFSLGGQRPSGHRHGLRRGPDEDRPAPGHQDPQRLQVRPVPR